jgi:hypothetical protein
MHHQPAALGGGSLGALPVFAPLNFSILDQFEKAVSASRICWVRLKLFSQLFLSTGKQM